MEKKYIQEAPDLLTIRNKNSLLRTLSEYFFVRRAFKNVVFDKLLFDGYVCCTEGLYPPNKDVLVKVLRQRNSVFYSIIEKNATSYEELIRRFNKIGGEKYLDEMIYEECQSVVYAVLEAEKEIPKMKCINEIMQYYFGKTRFSINGNFIVADDVTLQDISSLEKFISVLEGLPNNRNNIFRGHSNVNYGIRPSLFRNPRFYKNEYMMYQELVIRCPESFASCQTHLDFLVEMQHYGLPTRLLDFSLNPLVALYFACENPSGVGEVIMYSVKNEEIVYSKSEKSSILSSLAVLPYEKQRAIYAATHSDMRERYGAIQEELIEEIRVERPYFDRKLTLADTFQPIFVKPPYGNKRIAHQNGIFLLWGLDGSYYSDEIKNSYTGDKEKYRYMKDGKKVIFYVPSKRKSSIIKSLDRVGINKAYIYPEIDDVADYIKNSIV